MTLPAVTIESFTVYREHDFGKPEIFGAWVVSHASGKTQSGRTPIYKRVTVGQEVPMNHMVTTPSSEEWTLISLDIWESDGKPETVTQALNATKELITAPVVRELAGSVGSTVFPLLAAGRALFEFIVEQRRRPDLLGHGSFFVCSEGLVVPDLRAGHGDQEVVSSWTMPGMPHPRPSASARIGTIRLPR